MTVEDSERQKLSDALQKKQRRVCTFHWLFTSAKFFMIPSWYQTCLTHLNFSFYWERCSFEHHEPTDYFSTADLKVSYFSKIKSHAEAVTFLEKAKQRRHHLNNRSLLQQWNWLKAGGISDNLPDSETGLILDFLDWNFLIDEKRCKSSVLSQTERFSKCYKTLTLCDKTNASCLFCFLN